MLHCFFSGLGDKCSPDLLNSHVVSSSARFVLLFMRAFVCLLPCLLFGRGDSDLPPCCMPAVSLSPNEEQRVSCHMAGRHGDGGGRRRPPTAAVHVRPRMHANSLCCQVYGLLQLSVCVRVCVCMREG